MNYVALFDWDKTVRSGGYVLFDFIDILIKNNIIDKSIKDEFDKILKEHSEEKITYTEFAEKVIQIYRETY